MITISLNHLKYSFHSEKEMFEAINKKKSKSKVLKLLQTTIGVVLFIGAIAILLILIRLFPGLSWFIILIFDIIFTIFRIYDNPHRI